MIQMAHYLKCFNIYIHRQHLYSLPVTLIIYLKHRMIFYFPPVLSVEGMLLLVVCWFVSIHCLECIDYYFSLTLICRLILSSSKLDCTYSCNGTEIGHVSAFEGLLGAVST